MIKKYSWLNIIPFFLFFISTIITLFIVYKDIDNPFSNIFIIGYVIYLLMYALFLIIVAFVNIKKLSWKEIRKRTFNFIILFILLGGSNYLFNFFFLPEKINTYGFLFIGLGSALGLSFMDLALFRKKRS
ncbi:hypothetical protein KHA93_00225 [Bacillus sp. FJAT-49732]|uniref:Uncharacterized protein n=1 Tax=Lederbergia citrisecunda TaxID=2833583 RepID=A0A942TI54_9BACI|nr:hypothetical protein [Lederbergia citrisecunda]MBS4198085.1 hypothetical protein [Lederbergia citrisecunda]